MAIMWRWMKTSPNWNQTATFELPAEKAGILRIIAQEGDTLEIGAVVCTIEEGAAPAGGSAPAAAPAAEASNAAPVAAAAAKDEDPDSYAAGTASPAAAKILREKGIDPSIIKGTGKEGRITKEDAEKAQPVASSCTSSKTCRCSCCDSCSGSGL
jgi:2-oxoglutarate dehydrogenase E2 component (dihydrolipoamide succinyltransferase)